MTRRWLFTRAWAPCLLALLTALACNAPTPSPTARATPPPTVTPVEAVTPEPADTGWMPVQTGLSLRRLQVPTGDVVEELWILRAEPSHFQFRVLYTPGQGRLISEWAQASAATVVINGGYFTPEYYATGLVVSGGRAYGTPYGDFAGVFAVLAGGRVQVRWLAEAPYDPSEPILEAVQSFPMLVRPGGQVGFPPDPQDFPARRSVVAQDRSNRVLFLVAPRGYFTLHALAKWLVDSDLDIDVALNLDGGQSTGLYVTGSGSTQVEIDSQVPVPSVIVAEPHR